MGLKCGDGFIGIGNHHIDGGQTAMLQMLKLPVRPTAVLASNDLTAIGVIRAIHAADLRVPEDISVVGFDDIELSSFLQPPLTTIRVSRAEIGTRAFTALYSKDKACGSAYKIPTELVLRLSTGIAPTFANVSSKSAS
jgi:LacI family transcriptional regulator